MSITHTVVLRLSHAAGSAAEADFLAAAQSSLSTLPGVLDFTVSRQVSNNPEMAHQISLRVEDQQRYDAFKVDPIHRSFVAERFLPEVAAYQEYDFVAFA